MTFAREALLGNVCSVAFLLTGMFAQESLLRDFCSGRFAQECLLTGMFAHWHVCSPACLLTGIFAHRHVCSLDTKKFFQIFFKKIQFLKFNLESKKSKKKIFAIFFLEISTKKLNETCSKIFKHIENRKKN